MTIGIDASQANKAERTGTEWYAFSVIKAWIHSNAFSEHNVILYTREPLRDDFPRLPSHWVVKVLRWPPKIFWGQVRLSWEMLVHPIHCLFIPAHAIPFLHPKKTFTTIHDVGFEHAQELYSKKSVVNIHTAIIQRFISGIIRICSLGKYGANELDYHRFSVRYALRNAYGIFTVSRFSQSEIRRFFNVQREIIIAPNAIDHQEFYYPYDTDAIKKVWVKYGITGPYVLSIGRIEKKKNALAAVHALRSLLTIRPMSTISLVFAGPDGYGAEEVRHFITKNNLHQYVKFLGWVPQTDLAPLLAGATCFIFLSAYEGFGVPILQALALRTPVVANHLDVFKEIARNAIIYCDANNPGQIAREIYQLVSGTNPNLEHRKIHGAQIAKEFTWQKSAGIIENKMLESLAKKL